VKQRTRSLPFEGFFMQGNIDTFTEELIPIKDLARELPGQSGKPVHWMTVGRWCRDGLRGIFLESVNVGNQRCTTRQAWARFVEAQTRVVDAGEPAQQPIPVKPGRSRRQAAAAVRDAVAELQEAGA
jgi:hypothetical protein